MNSLKIIGIFLSIFCVSIIFLYYTISSYISRFAYSKEKQAIMSKNRTMLLTRYQAQPIRFKSTDNIELAGLLIERPQAKRVILLCHGYRSSKEFMLYFLKLFEHDTVFMFDFRGHNESTGDLISIGYHEKNDIIAAAQWLQHNPSTKNLPLVGLGVSMGAVSLIAAAAQYPAFSALIVDSPFASMAGQFARSFGFKTGLPRFPFLYIARFIFEYKAQAVMHEFDVCKLIKQIKVPIFIIHSESDTLIPIADAHALCKASNCKHMWIAKDTKHGHLCKELFDEYKQRVTEFLNSRD